MYLAYSPLNKLSQLCIEQIQTSNEINSMYLIHDNYYKPRQLNIVSESSRESFVNEPTDDESVKSEASITILEDITRKILLFIQYTLCFPFSQNQKSRENIKKTYKKKISFDLPATTFDSEEEIYSTMAFDSIEVPEAPVVDDLYASIRKAPESIMRKIFGRRKMCLKKRFNDGCNIKLDKCSGLGIPNNLKKPVNNTDADENDVVINVPNSGDGPHRQVDQSVFLVEVEDSKFPKRQKRAFDFFNEIYNMNFYLPRKN